jgi:acyl carrier protein
MIESLNECLALEKELKLEDNFRDNDEWDSMFSLILLTCLDENYSIKITTDKLKEFNTVKEIFDYYGVSSS